MTSNIINHARYIIQYALDHNQEISHFQLQRILYILDERFQQIVHHSAYDEPVVWTTEYGPRYESVLDQWGDHYSMPLITSDIFDSYDIEKGEFPIIPIDNDAIDPIFKQIVDKYLSALLDINIFDIVNYLNKHHHPLDDNSLENLINDGFIKNTVL